MICRSFISLHFFFFNDTATTEIYTLSLHDALPISYRRADASCPRDGAPMTCGTRSGEHTSELQSRRDLVCRLLLEKKKKTFPPALDHKQEQLYQVTLLSHICH